MTTYCVGSNMGGYMPDSEPNLAHNQRDALEMLKSELRQTIEVCEDEEYYSDRWIEAMITNAKRTLKQNREAYVWIGNRVHWVTPQ